MSTYWIEPTLHPEILRSVEMEAETEEEPDELERSARPGVLMRKTNLLLSVVLSVVLAVGQAFAADPQAGAKLPGGELSVPEYVNFIASAGGKEYQAASRIFAINDTMLANYDDMKKTIAKQLSPIIVAHFNGIGGTFTLQYKGRRRTVSPSPPQYAELKSVSHLPMGIYVIIAPYFKSPQERGWQEKLTEYRAKVAAGLDTIEQTDLTGASKQHCKLILTESIKYIDGIMSAGTFDVAGFKAYSQRVLPAIKANLYRAAGLQAEAAVHLLRQWRKEIGEEDWRNLWGAALAPFTLSVKNATWQAMYLAMNEETRDDQLLLIANTNDLEYSLETVAHLIMDRLLARLVFSEKTGADRELVKALSSKQDLVGDATHKAIELIIHSGSPFSKTRQSIPAVPPGEDPEKGSKK